MLIAGGVWLEASSRRRVPSAAPRDAIGGLHRLRISGRAIAKIALLKFHSTINNDVILVLKLLLRLYHFRLMLLLHLRVRDPQADDDVYFRNQQ